MSYNYAPPASITKDQATELGVDFSLAQYLVDKYNQMLYVDAPNRSKRGSQTSQVNVGCSCDHLKSVAQFLTHATLKNQATWILAAAGYLMAVGMDFICDWMKHKPAEVAPVKVKAPRKAKVTK